MALSANATSSRLRLLLNEQRTLYVAYRIRGVLWFISDGGPDDRDSQLAYHRRLVRQLQLRLACPCTFAQAPDNGFCESVLFWHIRDGHYGDINLDALSFVRVGRWEGDLWAGKAKGT